MYPPLHGGAQGFESTRLHSRCPISGAGCLYSPSCREGGCSRKTVYGPVRPYALGPEVWSTWLFPGNRNLPPPLKPGHVELRHVPGVLRIAGPTKRARPHHTSQVNEQPSCLRRVYTSLSSYLFHRLPGHVGLVLLIQATHDLGFKIVAELSACCLHKYLRTKFWARVGCALRGCARRGARRPRR